MDAAYVDFMHLLASSVFEAKMAYVEDHLGASLTPDTAAQRELLVRSLVGMAYRRFPRNRIGQYMVQG